MLHHDRIGQLVADAVEQRQPQLLVGDFEKGTYVAVKEAFKRVLPQQYAFLKELKEIIADKNQAKSI